VSPPLLDAAARVIAPSGQAVSRLYSPAGRILWQAGQSPSTPIVVPETPTPTPAPQSRPALRVATPPNMDIFRSSDSLSRMRTDQWTGALHPDTTTYVQSFVEQVNGTSSKAVSLNTWGLNQRFWVAHPDTPRVEVRFVSWNGTDLKRPKWDEYFGAVPIPNDASPALGDDRSIAIFDPVTYELWEMWKFRPRPGLPGSDNYYNAPYKEDVGGDYQASFGGYIKDTRQNRGIHGNVNGYTYGVAAASVSYGDLVIRASEAAVGGEINHALGMQMPKGARWNQFSWPAQRSDGRANGPVWMGTRFRLPPSLNIAGLTGLTPLARKVARAAQRYGIVYMDTTTVTPTLVTEGGSPNLTSDGRYVDPWDSLLANTQVGGGRARWDVLAGIPWHLLEAMPAAWGQDASTVVVDPPTGAAITVPSTDTTAPTTSVDSPTAGSTTERTVTINGRYVDG